MKSNPFMSGGLRFILAMSLLAVLVPALVTLFLLSVFSPAIAWGQTDPIADAEHLIDAVRTGHALLIAIASVNFLTSLSKRLSRHIPKRWRVALPVGLGALAGILSSVAGGMTPTEAIIIGLFSGPGAVFAHEAFTEAILGRAKSRGPSSFPSVVSSNHKKESV